MNLNKTLIKITSIATLLCSSIFVIAQEDTQMSTTQKIEARQEIMKGYKDWDDKVSDAFKEESIDPTLLKEAALFFQKNSGEQLLALFPNSDTPEGIETKAKSAIWRGWDEFTAITNDTNKAAMNVLELVEAGKIAEAKEAMNPIINSCRSCHKKYKAR